MGLGQDHQQHSDAQTRGVSKGGSLAIAGDINLTKLIFIFVIAQKVTYL